ncbi:MAG: thiamine-phosphate kinase [Pseudomonadota bacterium]
MDEFRLIEQFFSGHDSDVLLGIGDDAALIAPTNQPLAVAVDTLVAGVHFPNDAPPEAIGHRALAVNLSDLAAMGAKPRWMTLALTLPENDAAWVARFSRGLFDIAAQFGVSLIGGDTTRGPLTVTVQLLGDAPAPSLTRAAAQPQDGVYVGGVLGDAAGGLACWEQKIDGNDAALLRERFLYPQPQISLGLSLTDCAHSAIDVSDGLLADARHIAVASDVDLIIDADCVPVSDALRRVFGDARALDMALGGGDDYVLCFTSADAGLAQRFSGVQRIGDVVAGKGNVQLFGANSPTRTGYNHFD